MTEQPLNLRRDPNPVIVCACSHIAAEHNIDLKKQPCSHGGCGCAVMRPAERRYRVHGWLVEKIAG